MTVYERLAACCDGKYRDFQSKLVPNIPKETREAVEPTMIPVESVMTRFVYRVMLIHMMSEIRGSGMVIGKRRTISFMTILRLLINMGLSLA